MDNALPVNMTDTIGGNNLENFQRSEFGLIIFKNIFMLNISVIKLQTNAYLII